jgi:alanine racemase
VVKANAYGHGAGRVASVLKDADGFAVSTFDEAKSLRNEGIKHPIILLEGVTDQNHLGALAEHGFDCVLHCWEQLEDLDRLATDYTLNVWLKIDTGMHRLGFQTSDIDKVKERLMSYPQIKLNGLMTHLACADDSKNAQVSESQVEQFLSVTSNADVTSIANSAAIVTNQKWHGDWVRPGIMLYGASPVADVTTEALGLKPAMAFTTPVIAIRNIAEGECVGYGHRWKAKRNSIIATLAVGYGDGYPRHAPDGTPVFLNGQIVPLVGRVSMDMIMVDVTDSLHVAVGDTAELWGANLPVDQVAKAIGTIGYELLTRVSPRVPLVSVD